jgi:hypothetical protein
MSLSTDFLGRLAMFRDVDTRRNEMIAELVLKYEDLHSKYIQLRDDYNNEIESRRMWQNKATAHFRELTETRHSIVRSPSCSLSIPASPFVLITSTAKPQPLLFA